MTEIRVYPSTKHRNSFRIEKDGGEQWIYVKDTDIPSLVNAIDDYLYDFERYRYNGGYIESKYGELGVIVDEEFSHHLSANKEELREIKLKLLGLMI